MARDIDIEVEIRGAAEVIRALNKLPADAKREMRAEAKDIATSLADFIKIAGRKQGRQGPRAASTVREGNRGFWPVITASNTGRARGLLFGSIFGMTRHSGWYNKVRYRNSTGHQFRPYIGGSGYWFFKTGDERQSWIESEWHKTADQIVRDWSA